MSLISVIIPVYKVEPYLRRCVESVLAQTFQDFEIILVDDGSPDNCGAICDEYAAADSRIHVIHKENGGLSTARNAGLDAAGGYFISFLDSDDMMPPDFLQHAVSVMQDSSYDLYLTGFWRTRQDGSIRYKRQIPEIIITDGRPLSVETFLLLLKTDYTDSVWGKLYPRSLIGDLRFEPDLFFGEDVVFLWSLLQKVRRIYATPEIGCYYYLSPGSITDAISLKKCDSMTKFYRYMLHFDKEYWGREEPSYQAFCRKRWQMDYLSMVRRITDSAQPLSSKLRMSRALYQDRYLRHALYEKGNHRTPFSYNPLYLFLKRRAKTFFTKSGR